MNKELRYMGRGGLEPSPILHWNSNSNGNCDEMMGLFD